MRLAVCNDNAYDARDMAEVRTKQESRGGRFRNPPSPLMATFSESVSFDCELAPFDVRGSKAHATMLAKAGLITEAERDELLHGLDAVLADIEAGRFVWDEAQEDVHMNIEHALKSKIDPAISAKLHTARSRNDQVATDMRLYILDACEKLRADLKGLLRALTGLAEKNAEVLIPGYTHLQRAQPVSAAHHLLAYVEMFARDDARLENVITEAKVCPLGSGAIAGSTLPVDRECTARELGFVDEDGNALVTQNSMDAVADRDAFLDLAHACAMCGVHASRTAEDMILWNSAEFSYLVLPDEYTTGSSLMPQKKNPDCMELIRGKSARIQGDLHTLYTMVKGLPLTYNRDLQEDKPPLFDAVKQTRLCIQVLAAVFGHPDTRLNRSRCAAAVADPMLLATDLADWLVLRGVPFRKAHDLVGSLVALAEEKSVPLDKVSDADATGIDAAFAPGWKDVFDLKRAIRAREKPGMPGPEQTRRRIAFWKARLG